MTNEIACCDNLDFIKRIPDESIDFSYNDVPFLSINRGKNIFPRSGDKVLLTSFFRPRLIEIWRTLKPSAVLALHVNLSMLKPILSIASTCFDSGHYAGVYLIKHSRASVTSAKYSLSNDQLILLYTKARFSFYQDHKDFEHANLQLLSGVHVETYPGEPFFRPFQKPLSLMTFLVKTFSKPNDTVSDFFCGTGTTAVASILEGRNFVVCDIDPDAISITQKRVFVLLDEKIS